MRQRDVERENAGRSLLQDVPDSTSLQKQLKPVLHIRQFANQQY